MARYDDPISHEHDGAPLAAKRDGIRLKSPWPHVAGVVLFTWLGALSGAIPGCGAGFIVGLSIKDNQKRNEETAILVGLLLMACIIAVAMIWAFLRAYRRASERYAYEQTHLVYQKQLPGRIVVCLIACVGLPTPALFAVAWATQSASLAFALRVAGAIPVALALIVALWNFRPRRGSPSSSGSATQRVPELRHLVASGRSWQASQECSHGTGPEEVLTFILSSVKREPPRRVRRGGRVHIEDNSTIDWTVSVGLAFVDHGLDGYCEGRRDSGDGPFSSVPIRPTGTPLLAPPPAAVVEAQDRDPRLGVWLLPGVVVAIRPALSLYDTAGMDVFLEELRRLAAGLATSQLSTGPSSASTADEGTVTNRIAPRRSGPSATRAGD